MLKKQKKNMLKTNENSKKTVKILQTIDGFC